MNKDLDEEVLELLERRRGDWQAVAAASGVSYSWLSKFANRHIGNPGIETLKKLRSALIDAEGAPAVPTPTEAE